MESGINGSTIEALLPWVAEPDGLFVLTGAGVSTGSGIPDYRDRRGEWKRPQPVQYGDFVRSLAVRRRYWARSLIGWPRFAGARPGAAHRALARLECSGCVRHVVTQNVDGLHQRAGSRRVLDLHGRLDVVTCLGCGAQLDRDAFQATLARRNPRFAGLRARTAPDGDADLSDEPTDDFDVPGCESCGGLLKPAVVFFGESVPKNRVALAFHALERSRAMLVVGSSLMVWSGYRFAREAARQGKPVAIVNLGRTRADGEATLRLAGDCGEVLESLLEHV